MTWSRAVSRVVYSTVAALALALLCQATAKADPWPAWNASVVDPGLSVTCYYDQQTGHYRYRVAIDPEVMTRPVNENMWHEFRAFVVYPTNIGSYQPPSDKSFYAKSGGSYLPNTPGWTNTNGGFQLKGHNPDGTSGPAVPEDPSPSACFGWLGDWYPVTNLPREEGGGRYYAEFQANLPAVASNWYQTHFSLHVRDGSTWWVANSRAPIAPPIPEPGSLALLATGAVGLLPLLRRRRTS